MKNFLFFVIFFSLFIAVVCFDYVTTLDNVIFQEPNKSSARRNELANGSQVLYKSFQRYHSIIAESTMSLLLTELNSIYQIPFSAVDNAEIYATTAEQLENTAKSAVQILNQAVRLAKRINYSCDFDAYFPETQVLLKFFEYLLSKSFFLASQSNFLNESIRYYDSHLPNQNYYNPLKEYNRYLLQNTKQLYDSIKHPLSIKHYDIAVITNNLQSLIDDVKKISFISTELLIESIKNIKLCRDFVQTFFTVCKMVYITRRNKAEYCDTVIKDLIKSVQISTNQNLLEKVNKIKEKMKMFNTIEILKIIDEFTFQILQDLHRIECLHQKTLNILAEHESFFLTKLLNELPASSNLNVSQ